MTQQPTPRPEPNRLANNPARPASLCDLLWSFTWLALQGFGGVLAVVQRELVDKKHRLTRNEFIEDWAAAQVLPGPNVVNLSLMIGDRYFGLRGASVALASIPTFPMPLALVLAIAFAGIADALGVQGALRGMSAVAASLIAATGLKLARASKNNPMGRPVCGSLMRAYFCGDCPAAYPFGVGAAEPGRAGLPLGLSATRTDTRGHN
jgi:chromate transporter